MDPQYLRVFVAWIGAGGVDATISGDPFAILLLRVLGDLDEASVVCASLGCPAPAWALR